MSENYNVEKRIWIAAALIFLAALFGIAEFYAFEAAGKYPATLYWTCLHICAFGMLLMIPTFSEEKRDYLFICLIYPILIVIEDWMYRICLQFFF